MFCLFARICRHQFPKCDLLPLERSVPQLEIQILHFIIIFWTKNIPWNIAWNIPFVVELLKVRFSWSSIQRKECKMNAIYKPLHIVCLQGSLLLILRGGSLPLKYSNFQQFDKKLSQFDKKLRTGLIRLKVTSNPTLPKGQKPKWHLTTNCHTDKNGQINFNISLF